MNHTFQPLTPPPARKFAPVTLLTNSDLEPSANLVGVLFNIANVMRSHGINDEHVRYKETVKLLLARYCDEREGSRAPARPLALQVYPGTDPEFSARVTAIYKTAAKRYSLAKTLFGAGQTTELKERTLREIVRQIQGLDFSAASNETMQQVFMSFVPSVFKKSLDQYFTPIQLVKAMVGMVRIGPNDKVADPGMGTADFLTASAELRAAAGDDDILARIYGMDSDPKAGVDEPHRIVGPNVVVHRLRQQQDLRTFESRNVCHAGFYRAKRGSGIHLVRLSTRSAKLLQQN